MGFFYENRQEFGTIVVILRCYSPHNGAEVVYKGRMACGGISVH